MEEKVLKLEKRVEELEKELATLKEKLVEYNSIEEKIKNILLKAISDSKTRF